LPIDLARVRSVVVATGLVYASLDGFVAYSQWCTGTAARQMADRIEAAGLLPVTDPGDLASHVGDRFFQRAGPSVQPSYVVRAGRLQGAAITVTSGDTVLPRSYSLMALPPGTTGAAAPLPRSGTGYIQK
jgi:hypothetical protein